MTVNYHINQFTTPVMATIPDVVSLLEQINTSAGTWYTASGLANAFSSIPVHKIQQNSVAFS